MVRGKVGKAYIALAVAYADLELADTALLDSNWKLQVLKRLRTYL